MQEYALHYHRDIVEILDLIKRELLFENTFDLVLLNDVLEKSLAEAENIIEKYILD